MLPSNPSKFLALVLAELEQEVLQLQLCVGDPAVPQEVLRRQMSVEEVDRVFCFAPCKLRRCGWLPLQILVLVWRQGLRRHVLHPSHQQLAIKSSGGRIHGNGDALLPSAPMACNKLPCFEAE